MAVLKLGIGGIVVSFSSEQIRNVGKDSGTAFYGTFLTDKKPDVDVRVDVGIPEGLRAGKVIYSTDSFWNVLQQDGQYFFQISPLTRNSEPRGVMVLDKNKRKARVYLGDAVRGITPFEVIDLVMRHLAVILVNPSGVLLHGAGFGYPSWGMACLGDSGAGKSTIARLFARYGDGMVLGDDRVIVRRVREGYRVFGTPWAHRRESTSSRSLPLKAVFFLKHSPQNSLKPLSRFDATVRLFCYAFKLAWDKKAVSRTLKVCADLAARTPAYELSFRPDKSAISFIEGCGWRR